MVPVWVILSLLPLLTATALVPALDLARGDAKTLSVVESTAIGFGSRLDGSRCGCWGRLSGRHRVGPSRTFSSPVTVLDLVPTIELEGRGLASMTVPSRG